MMNKLVESVGARVRSPTPSPPQPPTLSSPKSSRKRIVGLCCGHSACRRRFLALNDANFKRSAVPSHVMYFRNYAWRNFSADVVETLRAGFLERKPIIEASIDGAKYIFDLKRMLEIDYQTANCRSISWIDENGKCFFPSQFFSEEDNEWDDDTSDDENENNNCNAKIEAKSDGTSSKRKREKEPEVCSSNKVQRLEGGAAKWPNTKLLVETEIDYVLVKGHFLNGIRKADARVTVTSIHGFKREGHLDKARLEVFQKQMENIKAARGTSNMVYAWLGVSSKFLESILAHGFSLPSKLPNVYGIGVYLSPLGLPHLSAQLANADDNGVKHLILCRVILGNVEKVEYGSKQYHPSSVDFDTGSDDPKNPKWYVVWPTIANMHILPENIVSFKHSMNIQGQPGPMVGFKYSLEKLFLKIKTSLPPVKVQELLMSYSTFKAGRMTRDAFIAQIRQLAGDEVLRSALQELIASGGYESVGIV